MKIFSATKTADDYKQVLVPHVLFRVLLKKRTIEEAEVCRDSAF
jgi:hypothetical protein